MRRGIVLLLALAAAGPILLLLGRGGASRSAAAQPTTPPTTADSFEPLLGVPASQVVVLGASAQAAGNTWAYGTLGAVPASVGGNDYSNQVVLLEHAQATQAEESAKTESAEWQVVPLPAAEGRPLSAGGNGSLPYSLGPLGARVSADGGVVLLGSGGIAIRDPGGASQVAPAPGAAIGGHEEPASALLGKGETLPPASAPGGAGTAYAAIDESTGHTGLLIAPYDDGADAKEAGSSIAGPGVLRYDGQSWSREPIAWKGEQTLTPQALACGPAPSEGGAAAPGCWLLASYHEGASGSEQNRLALFERVASGGAAGYSWQQVTVSDWLLGKATPPSGASPGPAVSALGAQAQTLTVTTQGVWVDFQAKVNGSPTATDFSELVLAPASAGAEASTAGHWCFGHAAPGCQQTLETALPGQYTSFASPGASAGEPGTRIVSGFSGGGVMELYGGRFHYVVGAGGDGGGQYGSVFDFSGAGAVQEGWIGEGGTSSYDHQGSSPLLRILPQPQGDQLVEQPVPFHHPLLALAQAPGTTPGDPNAAAIAVGLDGEIGRYTPGEGWSAEALYNAEGQAATPTLRGVAWPQQNLAYAVGDDGTMWVYRSEIGFWKPDPATPYNFVGNLNAIAFDPGKPQIGYVVGKQGVLLSYGKTWTQISAAESKRLESELKIGEQQLNFTSVAFAGGQALASYRAVVEEPHKGTVEAGGLLINEENGAGWHVDASAQSLLAGLPVSQTVLSKVAGLADGGAVAAGPGLVIERESDSDQWRFSPQPLPEAQNVSALAAYRESGGPVRAVVSIDLDQHLSPNNENLSVNSANPYSCDVPPPSSPGQPPPRLCADPVPSTGYLLRETAAGWEDMEHMAFEETDGGEPKDEPLRPDPVLALMVAPDGSGGLAVGGQTGDFNGSGPNADFETAAAMRYGSGVSTASDDSPAQILTSAGVASFAVGGEAACEHACADYSGEGLAPDVLLSSALQSAGQIATSSPGGLRGFLYTGGRVRSGLSSLSGEAAEAELDRYSQLLAGGGSSLQVYAASSPDVLGAGGSGLSAFTTALSSFLPGVTPGASAAYYSFTCPGSVDCPTKIAGGAVKTIVLDYSAAALGEAQQHWLEAELEAAAAAQVPAIVMGNASLGFALPEKIGNDPEPVQAKDAQTVAAILCDTKGKGQAKASAYLFDYPGINAQTAIPCGGSEPVPAFGTGTLGYTSAPGSEQTDSLGASAFLLLEVETGARDAKDDAAPVRARVEPVIGQLALDAADGTLLRRSKEALFEGLARIPASGTAVAVPPSGRVSVFGPEPYEPIPFDCLGANCADQVSTQYSFSSSKPDIGQFVVHEAGSDNPRQVQLGSNDKPIPDEARGAKGQLTADGRFEVNAKGQPVNEKGEVVPAQQSGLFCAYNEGATVVSITTGGLTYSMPITIQGGSPQYPCGTVPLTELPASQGIAGPPSPGKPEPQGAPFVPAIHLAVPKAPASHPKHSAPVYPLVAPVAGLAQLRPAILPPPPTVGRPSPPSGTSSAQVYQSAYAPQKEREEEAATDLVHSFAAYESPIETRLLLYGLPLALLLLAFVGARLHRSFRPQEPGLARQLTRRL